MSTLVTEVYDAFLAVGASEEKARAAAKAVADEDNTRLERLEADLRGLKWIARMLLVCVIALTIKTFWG